MTKTNKSKPVPAVIYARMASISEANSTSIQKQLVYLKKYAAKEGYITTEACSDYGISEATINRQTLEKLITDSKKGNWEVIIVKDISGLSRNTLDYASLKAKLEKLGIRIVLVEESAQDDIESLFADCGGECTSEPAKISLAKKKP